MKLDELARIELAEHLNELAGNVDPNLRVVPVRLSRGDWVFQVLDGGVLKYMSEQYARIRSYLMSGA